ncbi:MAG: ABC transporter substrate-binding protein [Desulfovibrionales bacterium]|nr:ABC transporter substrate-binding protein [Desulfovibrionales bacterium]
MIGVRSQNTAVRSQKGKKPSAFSLKRRLWRILIPCLIVLFLASASWAAVITYKDKIGRTVKIPVPVKRAVFFQTYELIPALGIWDRVVGIARWAYDNDLMKAAKPGIEKSVPSAGSGMDVNIEALLKLNPDVVITWTSKPETVRFMEETGLKVIAVYPEDLEELYGVMRLHGRLFGKEKQAEHCIARMESIFKLIKERVTRIPEDKRKRVLWLGGKPTSVACGIGVTDDVFKLIGGVNPAAQIPRRNADVPIERIIAWNPDVIFIWGNAGYKAQDILDNPQWKFISAVREGRVYKAPEWSTWSPRLAPVALWMAMKTYPEYFRDINLDRVTDEFYRKVFGIAYNQVKKIE